MGQQIDYIRSDQTDRQTDRQIDRQGQEAGPCDSGNEPSGSIKCGEFLD